MALFVKSDSRQALIDEIMAQHLAGVGFKQSLGLYDEWDEYDKFVQANHWPDPTPDTETLPRPVTNFVFADKEFLVAALLQESPVPYFIPREGAAPGMFDQLRPEGAKLLSEVAQFCWDTLHMPVLLEDVVDTGFTLGTGIFHFFWDESKRGGSPDRLTLSVGDIGASEIDPVDFFPGNPKKESVQGQPWIIVTERKTLSEVRDAYRQYAGKAVDQIQPDALETYGETSKWRILEPSPSKYVTLRHRWKITKDDKGNRRLSYTVLGGGRILRHDDELYPFPLYPFAVFRPFRRRKSFWGMGIVEQEINNQKETNRLDAMTLLSAYKTGSPATLYKPESGYKPAKRTNMPGEAIPDMSPPGQWGVRYLEPPQMPPYPQQWQAQNRVHMQQVVGALDAMTGRQLPGHQNASAIAYLQQVGFLRVNKVKERLYKTLEDSVRLWYAFWQHFYVTQRLVRIVGADDQVAFQWFRGTDYQDFEFDIRVKAGPGTILSRQAMMQENTQLLQAGILTPEEYIRFLPDEIFPYKEQVLERMKQQALAQQQQAQAAQAQPQMPPGMPAGGGVPIAPQGQDVQGQIA